VKDLNTHHREISDPMLRMTGLGFYRNKTKRVEALIASTPKKGKLPVEYSTGK
jgi:hypothetical protein